MYTIACTLYQTRQFKPFKLYCAHYLFLFTMKKFTIGFWVVTGLVSAFITLGSVYDIINNEMVQTSMSALGYPMYLAPFIGVMKLLGVAAILYQKWPKLTEWAYAGLTFELFGGVYSHLAAGQGFAASIPALVAMVLVIVSYCLNQKRTKV